MTGRNANCAIDFPDINRGWVEPDKSMADVVAKMEEMYSTTPRAHFAHPVRLTVKGTEIGSLSPAAENPTMPKE